MKYGGIRGTIITADANDKINITENVHQLPSAKQ